MRGLATTAASVAIFVVVTHMAVATFTLFVLWQLQAMQRARAAIRPMNTPIVVQWRWQPAPAREWPGSFVGGPKVLAPVGDGWG